MLGGFPFICRLGCVSDICFASIHIKRLPDVCRVGLKKQLSEVSRRSILSVSNGIPYHPSKNLTLRFSGLMEIPQTRSNKNRRKQPGDQKNRQEQPRRKQPQGRTTSAISRRVMSNSSYKMNPILSAVREGINIQKEINNQQTC